MNYQETIDYLMSSLPMFQRIGDAAVKKDLTNIRKLCEILGQPQEHFPCVHIAGTNGKGSTSHMMAAIFQAAGYKTGLYTSPHYVDFRERIRINGKMISKKDVVDFVEAYKDEWASLMPSFFEISVALAFDYFSKKKVDIAIIETGLGGRLDSTNIIHPALSVITNISFDHMAMLGNTLPEIAFEKAGIIKEKIPVVIGQYQKETSSVFIQKASESQAPLAFASKSVFLEKTKSTVEQDHYVQINRRGEVLMKFTTDLTGPYQQKNIATVLAACQVWNNYYSEKLTDEAIKNGLKNVKSSTGMVGRWMIVQKKPLVITDAAHNVDGIKNIMPRLKQIPASQKHFVLGFVSDKDISKILKLFPKKARYYWCRPDIPRGKNVEETTQEGAAKGLKGEAYNNVKLAYKAALKEASKKDLIFVGGSSYVVGDFLK